MTLPGKSGPTDRETDRPHRRLSRTMDSSPRNHESGSPQPSHQRSRRPWSRLPSTWPPGWVISKSSQQTKISSQASRRTRETAHDDTTGQTRRLPGQDPAGRRRPARARSNIPRRLCSRPGLRPDNRRGQAAIARVEPRLYSSLVAGRARAQTAGCSPCRRFASPRIPLGTTIHKLRLEHPAARHSTASDDHVR